MTVRERFDAKYRIDESGCWLWTASLNAGGYGQFASGSIGTRLAHRWRWEMENGPVPEGLELDHLCRVRHCVNPAHLEPVTRRENLLRGETLTAKNAAATHCPKGHPYDGDNLRVSAKGHRFCRQCAYERMYPGRDYASRGEPIAVINRAKTHCTKGHELTPHPTKPRRRCLVCERAAKLRYKARNPERRKADYAKWYAEHGAQYHRDRRARLKVAA